MSNNKKFLFDLNKFDEPEEPDIIEEIIEEEIEPPPPTFSEDDLEAARAHAHTQGKSEGIQGERAKREQELNIILGIISENFSSIFANETYREKAYEQEAVKLSLQLIEKLAPLLETKLGTETLTTVIKNAVLSQSKQSEIIVEVALSAQEEISALLDCLSDRHENLPRFKIKGRDDLTEGACALSWEDGGMVRDPEATADRIKKELMELLNESEDTVPACTNNGIREDVDSSIQPPIAETPQTQIGDNNDGSR